MGRTFVETFDHGPCGWIGWDGESGPTPVEIHDSVAISRGPWWIDCNHAPPGAGYLHILFALHTQHGPKFPESILKAGGPNPYVAGKFPTNLTNAKVTVRVKGEVKLRGAQMLLLAQGNLSKELAIPNWVNQVLAAQPFAITPEWSEQTIQLVPDPKQWINLGTRHDRVGFYGGGPIDQLLRDMNGDIILVLFPLDVRPVGPRTIPDFHKGWAERDYDVDRSRLPEGEVMLDEVRIEFP